VFKKTDTTAPKSCMNSCDETYVASVVNSGARQTAHHLNTTDNVSAMTALDERVTSDFIVVCVK
jgi:hypothetical protein